LAEQAILNCCVLGSSPSRSVLMKKASKLNSVGNRNKINIDGKEIDGKVHLSIKCTECGKSITVSNKYGMFCGDLHGLEDAKKADRELTKLINKLAK
jgi:hypothetical protein